MTPQQTAVLEALRQKLNPVAIHELDVFAVSENSVGSRLPELKLMGLVECRVRPGTRLKEWWVKKSEPKEDHGQFLMEVA